MAHPAMHSEETEAARIGDSVRITSWNGQHAALLNYVTGGGWALRPDVMDQFAAILNRHLAGERLAPETVADLTRERADDPLSADWEAAEEEGLRITQGVAVLSVSGVIAKHARSVNGVSQPRGTSIESLRAQFNRAMGNSKVKSILLHIESPGGYVAGTPDFASELEAARKTKPIIAVADDDACSAAYWIGSQASRFVANQNADVGSIGVICIFIDSSRMAENEGVRVIPVASGPHKATGLPGTPVTDERLAPVQKNIMHLYELFVAAVLRGRGAAGPDEAALREIADGRWFVGAEARDLRLVDDILPLADALRMAVRAGKNPVTVAARAAAESKERVMPDREQQDQDALAAARAEASEEQRERLKELQTAFSNDPARAIDAAGRGLTVVEAKAEAYDALLSKSADALAQADEEKTALAEENEKMKTLLGSKGVSAADIQAFDPSDVQTPKSGEGASGDGADDGKAETYQAAYDALVKEGKTKSQAHAEAQEHLPKAFEAWTKAHQPRSDA